MLTETKQQFTHIFPSYLDEKECEIRIESALGKETPIGYTRHIIVEIYLQTLFEFTYRIRTEIQNVISLLGRRHPRIIIHKSDFLSEQEMKDKVLDFKEQFYTEKEREERDKQTYQDTGVCVICKQPQTYATMPAHRHICIACKSYAEFIIFQFELGNIQTHQLLEERRLANKDGKWFVMIFPEEVKENE